MTCRSLIALGLIALAGGALAYGVDVRAALRHEIESTCVPVNSALFRMRQPDGVERVFVRDHDDPNYLHCTTPPWVGAIRSEGRMINILTSPEFKGEKTEFCFIDGVLRYMSVGKKDYEFPVGCFASPTNSIESLWPAAELTEAEKKDNDMWKGAGRLRLFSSNPNRAALIFVEVALIALGLAFFAGSALWRLHGVLWTLISVILLLQTQSRGGFLALVAGGAILFFFRWRQGLSRRLLLALVVAVFLLGGFAVVAKTGERVTVGAVAIGEDRSAQSRLFVWKEVPRMIAAAPLGWGLWKSGPAYNGWFEKSERMHMMGDLFNDHFSRMVEGGFVMGGLYVLVWSVLLLGGWCWAWRGGSALPLAVCAAYFVASSFNPMNWWTPGFYVPAAVLAWGAWGIWKGRFVTSGRKSAFPLMRLFAWAGGLTAAVLAGMVIVAWMAPAQDVPLRVGWQGRRVIVGEGEPKVWLVDDGFVLSGDYPGFPGREIREYYRAHPEAEPLGIVSDFGALPGKGVERLVVTGMRCWDYCKCPRSFKQVVLLTPPFGYDKISKIVEKGEEVQLLTGQFAARLTGSDWCAAGGIHIVRGAETYVPDWLGMLIKRVK